MVESAPCGCSAEPHQRRIFVANAERLVRDIGAGGQGLVGLPGNIVRQRPVAVLRRSVREQEQHVHEPLRIGRPEAERMVARGHLAGGTFPVGVAQIAGAVHHQAGVGDDLADDRLVALLCVGPPLLHGDAGGEGGPPGRRGHGQEALGVRRILGEEQSVRSAVVILPGEVAAVARVDILLVGRGKVGGRPCGANRHQRFGRPARRVEGVRQPGEAVAGFRLLAGEEGEHDAGILARAHRVLGPPPELRFVGPARIGVQKARIVGEGVAAALAKPPPVVQRITDAVAVGRSGDRRRLRLDGGLRSLRGAGGRRDQQRRKNEGDTSHAGHYPTALLISP